MKIHPKFEYLMAAFKAALDPISPSYWCEHAVNVHKEWKDAGCPVVEEEKYQPGNIYPVHQLISDLAAANARIKELEGYRDEWENLNNRRDSELFRANAKILEQGKVIDVAHDDLRKADARISELEHEEKIQKDSFYGRIRIETAKHIRNAALEEAARACDSTFGIVTNPRAQAAADRCASRIRALKKGGA